MIFTIAVKNGPEFQAGLSAQNKVHVALDGNLPMEPAADSKLVYTWYCEHNLGNWQAAAGQDWNDFRIPYRGLYTMQAKLEYYHSGRRRPYAAFWSNKIKVHVS